VSVAAEIDGVVGVGVVFDPLRDELFVATNEEAATLNGTPIHVGRLDDPSVALVSTGFGYQRNERAEQGQLAARVLPQVRDLRRSGAAVIDLRDVACGRLDCYYDLYMSPWHFAAGALIARQSGAVVVDFAGARSHGKQVVASNPTLAPKLCRVVGSAAQELQLA
jgi:myo-inositol-1(or 4)-monophosphatase